MECPYCKQQLQTTQGLGNHLSRKHHTTYAQYLHETVVPWPKCKCGCGKDVPLANHGTIISEWVHGHNNTFEHQSHAGHFGGLSWTGRKHRLESRDKCSQTTIKNYQKPGGPWQRGQFYSEKNQTTFIYRSSWERRYMEQLEADQNVESYRYESFVINYEYEGVKRRYLPDFLVRYRDGSREIVEIGQKRMKETGLDKAKIDAAKAFCEAKRWKFRLLTEENLISTR